MGTSLPATRMSNALVQAVEENGNRIIKHVRTISPALTKACVEAGLPTDTAMLCGGLLASVIEDLIAVSRLPRTDFERTKRKERILAAAQEPASSALRIAIAASPVNGRAAVAHWDVICDQQEIGKLAWLLGMPTETAYRYSKRVEKRG